MDRSALLRDLGFTVVSLPYELHPGIPPSGLSFRDRWGARHAEAEVMYERVAGACAEAGLPFRRPTWIPNTRRALETAEWVRLHADPGAFAALETALFTAHFVEGRSLGNPVVLDELVEGSGADAGAAREAVEAGTMRAAVDRSMERAEEAGVTAVPAWLLDRRLLVRGAQPRTVVTQLVERLRR